MVTEHTLTFSGVTVTVDGASVTSPYTLTKDCTIVATGPISDKFTKYGLVCNETLYTAGTTSQISIANTDIKISYYIDDEWASVDTTTLTINYTA